MSLCRFLARSFSIVPGTAHSMRRVFTSSNVQTYGDLIDDHNTVHFSAEKAIATGLFTGRIAHGMLVASVFSHLLAKHYPRAIYLNQTLKFTKPVYLDEEVEGKAVIKEVTQMKKGTKCILTTTVTKVKDDSVAVEGEATILILEEK